MRIQLTCVHCINPSLDDRRVYPEPLQEEGVYLLKCEKGHESRTVLQEHRFEILFDLALHAIADGYYREAVASFTSSLERFYEFYLQIICMKHNVPPNEFEKAWDQMSPQSERQLGAYIAAYLLENHRPPPLLPASKTKFRNKVVHQGVFPSREDAIAFGNVVYDLVSPILEELKLSSSSALQQAMLEHSSRIRARHEEATGTISLPTTLNSMRPRNEPWRGIEQVIEEIARHKQFFGY